MVKNITGFFLWAIVLTASAYFFLDNVWVFVYGYRSKIFGDSLFNNHIWFYAHLVGGTLALFIGPIQFWKVVRDRYINFHRLMGKIYIVSCFLVGLSALRLSLQSLCVPCRISLFINGALLLLSVGAAWYTIRQRNVKAHRQFMVRSYVLLLAFVFVRIDGLVSLNFLFGDIQDPTFARTVQEYFFSFVPLIITEIIMTWLPTLKRRKART